MKALSIRKKLLWITSFLFLATVTILCVSNWWALNNKNKILSVQIQKDFKQEAQLRLASISALYSEKISGFINESFRIPYSFAGIMEHTEGKNILSRTKVESTLGAIFKKNKELSSIYAQFENNGYDQLDNLYKAGDTHSVPESGTLEVYFYRDEDGSVEQEQVEDPNEKYLTELNEFGIRAAQWYLCPKETKKSCLLEPYLEEVSPGNSMMMTSLTVPVIIENTFRGVIGVDLHLPVFQRLINELSQELYDGKTKVTLLSSKGIIVASSNNKNIGKLLTKSIDPDLAKKYLHSDKNKYLETENNVVIYSPIKINLADSVWTLVIEIPKNIAFEASSSLDKIMKDSTVSLNHLQLIIGIAASIFALFAINILIRSILAPLNTIQSSVENLASNEGDLTQSLTIESHAELIALSNGFNTFILKLHSLIFDLKALVKQSKNESLTLTSSAQNAKDAINNQYVEIENVVTAIKQMSTIASEVAKSSQDTVSETKLMLIKVTETKDNLSSAMTQVSSMSEESKLAIDAVDKVVESTNNISGIIDVIRAIADQTNLLALNAAIEAARAGEQGRGFAVVADEVRSLASKTQNSTSDINRLIDSLRQEVTSASEIIQKNSQRGLIAVEQTQGSVSSINSMVGQINKVSDQVMKIAKIADEQNEVTQNVGENLKSIYDTGAQLTLLTDKAQLSSSALAKLIEEQNKHLDKLKT